MMQPPVEPCRSQLTADQVTYLIRDAPSVRLAGGMEIVDLGLNVLDDVSDYLAGGSVSRDSYADLHATCEFGITRELDWGAGLVRPYLTLTDGTLSARFNLGVYHTSTPQHAAGESPPTFRVQGYDMLLRLADPVGDAFGIAAGISYLAKVEDILLAKGYTEYVIDQTAAATLTPSTRTWTLEDNVTWLKVVNDLLASIGYAGIYSDWNGTLRVEPYILPANRTIEWFYSDDPATTMLATARSVARDYFSTPNRWVAVRSNLSDGNTPVEGDGVFTFTNQSVGESSIDARGGRTITKRLDIDAADQASLVAAAQQTIAADMSIPQVITVSTFPNPLHWHFDRLFVADASTVPYADLLATNWRLPLPPDTGDMAQTWRVIVQ